MSDHRYEGAPCFLYAPEGQADLVFVDYFPSLQSIASWSIWNQPIHLQHPVPAFFIAPIHGKGLGMIAQRPINAGEMIVTERPVWAGRSRISCAADQTNANGIFHRAAIRGLSEPSRIAFFALANSYPPAQYDVVPGILNTNCLGITVPTRDSRAQQNPGSRTDTETYIACFPTLSRANHDCTPNAHYVFSPATFAGEFRAIRNIAAGEEITITYTSLCAPSAERCAFLATTRFFDCRCATCALPAAQLRVSDARRMCIREMLVKIEEARFPPRIPISELREAVGWARSEGLRVEEGRLLLCGSQVLTVYDGLDVAMGWAKEARKVFETIEGARSEYLRKLDDAYRVHQRMAAAPRPLNI